MSSSRLIYVLYFTQNVVKKGRTFSEPYFYNLKVKGVGV